MGQTIAEALREEGMIEGERKGELKAKRQTLILQLRQRFARKVTAAVVAAVEKTNDVGALDRWLAGVLEADSLEELGITAKKR